MSPKDAPISPENKLVARYVAAAFGGSPRVDEYLNASETLAVGILYSRDRPGQGVTAYSTIKLSDHPMPWGEGEYPTRLELAGLCMNTADFFPNVLASASFRIMQSEAVYYPGTVLTDIEYPRGVSPKLPHLYLTAPFPWEHELKTLDCGSKKVSWLLAMPISESEYSYVKEHGDQALEDLLEERRADFANPDRPSVV
jgi:hypothetical protein